LPVSGTVGISSLPPVSITVPAQPFFQQITLSDNNAKAAGVAGERLAVTTITFTNFASGEEQLNFFMPLMSGSDCNGSVIGGTTEETAIILQPSASVQLQFPTPMVFSLNGQGCIAAQVTTALNGGSVEVNIVGYAVP
jgi:hypothetical protein